MLRFGRGDAAAFELLYRRYEGKVFRYLERSVRNEALANDLMQEVWFAIARNAAGYQVSARFSTWLFTIAHNRVVDSVRTSRPMDSLDASEDSRPDGATIADRLVADVAREPLNALETQGEVAVVMRAVAQLPAEQRSAFLLQAEGDLSVEEIATTTGASFETVKSRLRYARTKLRQLLWEYA
jgi:RNA polymerase sigma factor (sigma-70 family)